MAMRQISRHRGVNPRSWWESKTAASWYEKYSWHLKSAYTHLQFCGFEHCGASPTDPWASVIMPSGIAHQTLSLQPQLLRFLQTLARLKYPAKRNTGYWQKADSVSSRSQSH